MGATNYEPRKTLPCNIPVEHVSQKMQTQPTPMCNVALVAGRPEMWEALFLKGGSARVVEAVLGVLQHSHICRGNDTQELLFMLKCCTLKSNQFVTGLKSIFKPLTCRLRTFHQVDCTMYDRSIFVSLMIFSCRYFMV